MGEATRLPVQELRDELVTSVIAVSLFSELSSLWVETIADRFLRSLLHAGSRNNVVDDEVDPSILLQVSVGPVGSPRGTPPSPSGSRASKPNLRGDELGGNALPSPFSQKSFDSAPLSQRCIDRVSSTYSPSRNNVFAELELYIASFLSNSSHPDDDPRPSSPSEAAGSHSQRLPRKDSRERRMEHF